ncbi:hypothetical protein CkaCkLH20_01733 [Colletotrichum karsti]|uniref:IgE-binding protein n=1 Tax=Colletotrichum karsti TaxID=1095194 RepID=A0A9P6IF10_9PEZI|nr:uncharacterized protein CkaCkLH20_01733 [Colletotrichum karsti]KAF9880691.1 hypothetical protein CkaCkLH20_01733 [Colletotrichum karsti]
MIFTSILLLVLAATLAAGESYTLTAHAPANRAIHGARINASGRRLLVGLDAPSSYCPDLPHIVCPAGTSTTVDEDLTHLRVSTPGGQAIYVAPDGVVSYTAAHSAYMPPGSTTKGFYAKTMASSCSAERTEMLDFLSVDGADKGLFACPNPDLAGTWVLVAAGRESRALKGDCVVLEGLELRRSEVEIGAWQY